VPELPEVETIRRGLTCLEGAVLQRVAVREVRLRRRVSSAALARMVGRRLETSARRAKYLLLAMSGGGGLVIHLGMSGRLFMAPPDTPLDPHDHVSWWFERSGAAVELRFRDPRRFGLVAARDRGRLRDHPLLRQLGPEPLGERFTAEYAFAASCRARRPVKNALMDPRFVVGVGNIYASESLWRAGVNPKTMAGRMSRRRWAALRDAVREVLQQAVDSGGTTLNDFRDASGDPGYFQVRLQAYGREGEACVRCGAGIRRIVQGGRSTFYCAGCQH
jgi:formamidopyrimidine-DNA glycosylase